MMMMRTQRVGRPSGASRRETTARFLLAAGMLASFGAGCSEDTSTAPMAEGDVAKTTAALEQRAYVVSKESDELSVIDLRTLDVIAKVPTGGVENHMAELNADFTKVYVSSPGTSEVVVIDARSLGVINRIKVGREATHLSASPHGDLLAVMDEDEGKGAVSFIDMRKDIEIKRLEGFYTPHFMRYAPDGRYGYVANLNAHHITRVDLETLEIDGQIALDGFDVPTVVEAPDEGGFADAQINTDGMLYAAHASTGRVLVYDTEKHAKMPDLQVGKQPWIVYAEHPFAQLKNHVVPNFGDESVSVISSPKKAVLGSVGGADRESFGVNYSPLTPNTAFVMNRFRNEIAVLDMSNMKVADTIPVGGTTETAATTADGKLVIASVSGSDHVAVIDVMTHKIQKQFDNIGLYPWSVTIPRGQNYCH